MAARTPIILFLVIYGSAATMATRLGWGASSRAIEKFTRVNFCGQALATAGYPPSVHGAKCRTPPLDV